MKDKRVVFMGTPEFSVPVLKELIDKTNVVLVVTMPDKVRGRKNVLTPSPIKEVALKNNIEVFTPNKIRNDFERIREVNPDIIITCAYGGILPKELLLIPSYGCINVHASLLPKYRGASPMQAAIMNGDKETGITIMYMDETMDTGNIISQDKVVIEENDNLESVHDKLSVLGSNLLIKTLPSIFNQTNDSIKQDETLATYCKKITKEDEHLSFNDLGVNIFNKVRALNPYPGCYIILNNNILKISECKLGEEINSKVGIVTNIDKDYIYVSSIDKEIIITKVKPEGKKEMLVRDYLNGLKENIVGVEVK